VNDARSYLDGLHALQTAKLFDDEKQEERSGSPRAEQILPVLPQAHLSQGSEMMRKRLLKRAVLRGRRRDRATALFDVLFEDFDEMIDDSRGAWCSTASTSVSKTEGPGSIPGAPANSH
jgi:hypothetical protein